MEEENKVSVWFAYFESEEVFKKYIQVSYDKRGDVSSLFMDTFSIDSNFIDNQESIFCEQLTKDKFLTFSYSEFFVEKIGINFESYNAAILVFDYHHLGEGFENVSFEGVFDYR